MANFLSNYKFRKIKELADNGNEEAIELLCNFQEMSDEELKNSYVKLGLKSFRDLFDTYVKEEKERANKINSLLDVLKDSEDFNHEDKKVFECKLNDLRTKLDDTYKVYDTFFDIENKEQ